MSIDYKTYQAKDERKNRAWQWLFLGCFLGLGLSFSLTLEKSWKERWSTFEFKSFWKWTKQPGAESPQKFLPKPQVAFEEPKFDFYNVLPEMEVVIPPEGQQHTGVLTDRGKTSDMAPKILGDKPPDPFVPVAPVYILQVGAFKAQSEAEHLKAELALLGLQAGIEISTMPSGTTWYRVKLGPYATESATDKDKQKLQEQGIRSFKVKIER